MPLKKMSSENYFITLQLQLRCQRAQDRCTCMWIPVQRYVSRRMPRLVGLDKNGPWLKSARIALSANAHMWNLVVAANSLYHIVRCHGRTIEWGEGIFHQCNRDTLTTSSMDYKTHWTQLKSRSCILFSHLQASSSQEPNMIIDCVAWSPHPRRQIKSSIFQHNLLITMYKNIWTNIS